VQGTISVWFAVPVWAADGSARVPVVRRIRVGKPTAPPPWHSLSGTTLGRSSTLAGLLAGYQLPVSSKKPSAPAVDERNALDPLDVAASPFAVPDLSAVPRGVDRHRLAYFLLRRLDEQLLADDTKSIARTSTTALFSCLRRLIALCAGPYRSGSDDPSHVDVVSLHVYCLLVGLRSLRVAVVSLPPESTAFRAGEKEDSPGRDSEAISNSAPFVSQLNALLSWPATHAVAQIAVAGIHEIIAETLSQGEVGSHPSLVLHLFSEYQSVWIVVSCSGLNVFCPTARERCLVLTSLLSRCIKDRAQLASYGPLSGLGRTDQPSDLSVAVSRREVEVRSLLLKRYFTSMSSPRQIVALLSLIQRGGADAALSDVISGCLAYLMQSAETAVLDVVTPQEVSQAAIPEHVLAVRDFLQRLLAVIAAKATRALGPQDGFVAVFVAFAKRCLAACTELLSFCSHVGKWPTDPAVAPPLLLDQKSKAVKAVQTVVGGSLMVLATSLPHVGYVCLADHFQLVKLLLEFGNVFQALTLGLPELVSCEHEYASGTVKWIRSQRTLNVETLHPLGTTSFTQLVHVPGATSLTVDFDPLTAQTLQGVRLQSPLRLLLLLRPVLIV
jgi:hypothetical protein